MGARQNALFRMSAVQEQRRDEVPDNSRRRLKNIVALRPSLKLCIDTLPTSADLHTLKREGEVKGALIILDPIDAENPEEIVERRPFLDFYNGRIPSDNALLKLSKRGGCDGAFIIFKRLSEDEEAFANEQAEVFI